MSAPQSQGEVPADANESELESEKKSPVKKGYEADPDFDPEEGEEEDENDENSLVSDEEPPVKKLKQGVPIVKSMDFTKGSTRLNKIKRLLQIRWFVILSWKSSAKKNSTSMGKFFLN